MLFGGHPPSRAVSCHVHFFALEEHKNDSPLPGSVLLTSHLAYKPSTLGAAELLFEGFLLLAHFVTANPIFPKKDTKDGCSGEKDWQGQQGSQTRSA